MGEVVLKLDRVSKAYAGPQGNVVALPECSLSVAAGEFVALHGPSGCGKSTLLLMAGGLLPPDSGTAQVHGTDPYALSAAARAAFRAEQIGFMFQQFHLIPYLSVIDNLLLTDLARNLNHAESRAQELAKRLGLAHRLDHVPSRLSVGEQQRVAFARAAMQHPRLLLADEPTGNLDEENSLIVLDTLRDFAGQGAAVLMVTHDRQALESTSRSIELKKA